MKEQDHLILPMADRKFLPSGKSDGKAPSHPEALVLAQVALLEGDLEEAITLAEEAACFDAFEESVFD